MSTTTAQFDPKKFLPRTGIFLYDRTGHVLLHAEGEHGHWGVWEVPVSNVDRSQLEIRQMLDREMPKDSFTIRGVISDWTCVTLPEKILKDFSEHKGILGIAYQWIAVEAKRPLMEFAPLERQYNFKPVFIDDIAGRTAPYKRMAYHNACRGFKSVVRDRVGVMEKLQVSREAFLKEAS